MYAFDEFMTFINNMQFVSSPVNGSIWQASEFYTSSREKGVTREEEEDMASLLEEAMTTRSMPMRGHGISPFRKLSAEPNMNAEVEYFV